jgi:hypothetical protein
VFAQTLRDELHEDASRAGFARPRGGASGPFVADRREYVSTTFAVAS